MAGLNCIFVTSSCRSGIMVSNSFLKIVIINCNHKIFKSTVILLLIKLQVKRF